MTTIVAPPWEEQRTEGGITDAPTDGKTYGRKDAAWAEVVSAATAGDIVAASALPLPDVWAPLSDSLRLITGYGRDVLVGSDVVARMVNFSRNSTATYIGKDGQLRTAAANEPRFEKEGLLIEGQSTNVHTMSETTASDGNGTGTLTTTTLDGSPALLFQNTNSVYASVPLGSPTLTVGSVYTVSIFTDKSISECAIDVIAGVNAPRITLSSEMKLGNGLYRRWASFTAISSAVKCHYYVATVSGGCKVGRMQVEELPFASSYIPTTGAAVTRAADVCDIPKAELNYRPAYNGRGPMTVAVNYDILEGGLTGQRFLVTAEAIGGGESAHSLFAANAGGYSVTIGSKTISSPSRGVAKYILNPSDTTFSVDAKNFATYSGLTGIYQILPNLSLGRRGATNTNFLFGHIRDLRIYFAKLSDEQFKAVA